VDVFTVPVFKVPGSIIYFIRDERNCIRGDTIFVTLNETNSRPTTYCTVCWCNSGVIDHRTCLYTLTVFTHVLFYREKLLLTCMARVGDESLLLLCTSLYPIVDIGI